ncbi:MAG: beta strand repeat-containing protein [Tepidisphaerales bacterium]
MFMPTSRKPVRRAQVLCVAAAGVATAVVGVARGQVLTPVSYTGGTYSQNFDTLPAASPSGAFGNAAGASVTFTTSLNEPVALTNPAIYASSVTPPAELTGWGFARLGGTGSAVNFRFDNGGNNSGAVYSYGAQNSGDRALGSLASGTTIPRIGVVLINNTSTTFNGFTLGFAAEQWRSSTSTQNQLEFGFAVGSSADALFGGPMTPVSRFNAVAFPPVGTNGATNGNAPEFRRVLDPTPQVGGGFSWAPGQVLALTWSDVNDVGNDAGIGIDDLTFEAFFSFVPRDLVWAGGTGPTANAWDTTSPNWTGDASVYSEGTVGSATVGDNVRFTGNAPGVIAIRPAGVSPNSLVVEGNADYTFSGGPIGGATSLVKSGGGTLTLASPNSFAGGVQLTGGTLQFSDDAQLGTGAVSVTDFATLRATSPVVSGKVFSFVGAGGTFDTGPHTVRIATLSAGQVGAFVFPEVNKNGSGDLIVSTLFTAFGSRFSINGGRLVIQPAAPGSTNSIGANFGDNFAGTLVLDDHMRLEIAAADGESRRISGGGQVIVRGGGRPAADSAFTSATLSQLVVVRGEVDIRNAIVVNPDNNPNFVVSLGATAGGGFVSSLVLSAPLTGNTDVNFGSGVAGGAGGGIVDLRTPLQHTGRTLVNQAADGFVRIGTDNALPPTTDLIFGNGTNNGTTGAIDLAGRTLTVASLRTLAGTNPTGPTSVAGIANSAGAATLEITGSATTTYTGGIGSISPVNPLFGTPNTNISLRLTPAHTGHLTLTGTAGTVNYTGSTTVEGGKLTFATPYRSASSAVAVSGTGQLEIAVPTARLGTPPVAFEAGTVTLSGNARLTVAPGDRTGGINQQAVVIVSGLSVSGNAFVDLTNNDLIVRNGNLANLRSLVRSWLVADAGLPGSVGLGSSLAFYTAGGAFTTLAVYDNSAGLIGDYNGVSVSPSDVIVKYTYVGDTDLSGAVDAADLARVLQGYNGGGTGWNFGDVNYDGVVDDVDLGRVLAALRGQGAPLGQSTLGGGGGAIPEPASLGLLALAAPLMTRRRR